MNNLELNVQDVQMFRSVAYFMMEILQFNEAVELFERVLDLSPGEPHSKLDLALALFMRARYDSKTNNFRKTPEDPEDPDDSQVDEDDDMTEEDKQRLIIEKKRQFKLQEEQALRKAIGLLESVIIGDWPVRFIEIEYPTLIWINWIANYAVFRRHPDLWPSSLPATMRFTNFTLGLVINMGWDTDKTDLDLHVIEPSGELCFYSNKVSKSGGQLSKDFTQGYGPEVYASKNPPKGKYDVETKYYSSHQHTTATGATSCVLWCVKFLGDFTKEEFALCMVRLNLNKELMKVLEVRI